MQLVRVAPEHLWRATPLETSLSDYVGESRHHFIPQSARGLQPQCRDLGAPPSKAELGSVDDPDVDLDDMTQPLAKKRRTGVEENVVDQEDDYSDIDMNAERFLPPIVERPNTRSDVGLRDLGPG